MVVAVCRFMLCAVLSLVAVSPVLAQQRGSISGKVVDQGELALPGATITITEQSTGFTRTAVTA